MINILTSKKSLSTFKMLIQVETDVVLLKEILKANKFIRDFEENMNQSLWYISITKQQKRYELQSD